MLQIYCPQSYGAKSSARCIHTFRENVYATGSCITSRRSYSNCGWCVAYSRPCATRSRGSRSACQLLERVNSQLDRMAPDACEHNTVFHDHMQQLEARCGADWACMLQYSLKSSQPGGLKQLKLAVVVKDPNPDSASTDV